MEVAAEVWLGEDELSMFGRVCKYCISSNSTLSLPHPRRFVSALAHAVFVTCRTRLSFVAEMATAAEVRPTEKHCSCVYSCCFDEKVCRRKKNSGCPRIVPTLV